MEVEEGASERAQKRCLGTCNHGAKKRARPQATLEEGTSLKQKSQRLMGGPAMHDRSTPSRPLRMLGGRGQPKARSRLREATCLEPKDRESERAVDVALRNTTPHASPRAPRPARFHRALLRRFARARSRHGVAVVPAVDSSLG